MVQAVHPVPYWLFFGLILQWIHNGLSSQDVRNKHKKGFTLKRVLGLCLICHYFSLVNFHYERKQISAKNDFFMERLSMNSAADLLRGGGDKHDRLVERLGPFCPLIAFF